MKLDRAAFKRKCLKMTRPQPFVPALNIKDERAVEMRAILNIVKELRPKLMSWDEVVTASLTGTAAMNFVPVTSQSHFCDGFLFPA